MLFKKLKSVNILKRFGLLSVPHQADTSVVHQSGKVDLVSPSEERSAAAF